jgi:aldose 1-epimerase
MLPSGEQFLLSDGRQEAVVCEVGATLRRYVVDGRPICWGFKEQEMSTAGRGQILAPWPNRLEDGRYVHDGVICQAALDEPERSNAIHGLVRWLPWRVERVSAQQVNCTCILHAQPGYPFTIKIDVAYVLVADGLLVRTKAENLGHSRAPFGLGFHNYLHGGEDLGRCRLQVPATHRIVVDERMLPRAVEPLSHGPLVGLCATTPEEIGALELDDCLTGLAKDDDGRWRVRFVPANAQAIVVWAESCFGFVTLFSGDTLALSERRRGLAVEPMTCPANAFRSGEGLIMLEPGQCFWASWGISPEALVR